LKRDRKTEGTSEVPARKTRTQTKESPDESKMRFGGGTDEKSRAMRETRGKCLRRAREE